MAIILCGLMNCSLCGELLQEGDDLYGFPAFTGNGADPLYPFNDAGFHRTCLEADALGRKAIAAMEERATKVGPRRRKCQVCGEEIQDPDDCAMIDYICMRETHPVAEFNYTHCHRSHLEAWPRLAELVSRLEQAWRSGVLPREVALGILKSLDVRAPKSWRGTSVD